MTENVEGFVFLPLPRSNEDEKKEKKTNIRSCLGWFLRNRKTQETFWKEVTIRRVRRIGLRLKLPLNSRCVEIGLEIYRFHILFVQRGWNWAWRRAMFKVIKTQHKRNVLHLRNYRQYNKITFEGFSALCTRSFKLCSYNAIYIFKRLCV